MNLRALQYFIALAELRHFRKAAERCHVSQPTLSTQIRKLEQQLGADLIERNSRQVLLTPLGERVLEHAKKAVSETQAIRQLARDADDPFAGTLSLGIFPTLAPYLLPHVIPKLRTQYPNLTVRLFEEKTERVMAMLLEGQLDAILLALPLDNEQLHVEPLFDEPFVLVAPETHRFCRAHDVALEDLQREQVLLLEDGHCLRQHALDVCQLAGALENLDFQASSLETLRHMVAAGSGITLLPILATQPPLTTMDGLIARPFRPPAPQRTIAMAWRKSSLREELLTSVASLFKGINPALLSANG